MSLRGSDTIDWLARSKSELSITEAAPPDVSIEVSVLVEVTLRAGIADPQGSTIERALPALGFDGISGVTVGKAFRFTVDAPDQAAARSHVDELCQRFLTNPVMEDADITITVGAPA